MKNKSYKKESNDKIKQIQNILDPNYFYTKVYIGKDRSILWTVYYKNLPSNTYYPQVNTKVLSSKNNSIQDIYNLKRKFDDEKNRFLQNNMKEYINLKRIITTQINRIKKLHMKLSMWLLWPLILASLINVIKYKNQEVSILISVLIAALTVIITYQQFNMDKYIDKEITIARDRFLKEKIKRQGIWFLNSLRG